MVPIYDALTILFVIASASSFSYSVIEPDSTVPNLEVFIVSETEAIIKLRCHEPKRKVGSRMDDIVWEYKRCGYGLRLTACEDLPKNTTWQMAMCRNGTRLCTGLTLPISAPTELDSGLYRCLHKNYMEHRFRVNRVIQLEIRDPRSKSIEMLPEQPEIDSQTVFQNQNVVLRCRVRSMGYPHIVWAKLAVISASSPSFSVGGVLYQFLNTTHTHDGPDKTYTSKLYLHHVQPSDAGNYFCFALDAGQNFSKTVSLNVVPLLSQYSDAFVSERFWWITTALVISGVSCIFVLCFIFRRQKKMVPVSAEDALDDDSLNFPPSLC